MEILGSGPQDHPEADAPRPLPLHAATAGDDLDLGVARPLGGDGAADGAREPAGRRSPPPGATPPAWTPTLLAVLSPPALALTGLLVPLLASTNLPIAAYYWAGLYGRESRPGEDAAAYTSFTAGAAALGLTLGAAAVWRLRAEPSPAGRALAGAAVLVGALGLAYAGALLFRTASG